MAFVFPEDKADFKAPNGVTYHWDGAKWRTKTYSGAEVDGRLPYRLGTDKAARSARSGEPAVELVDAEDNFSNVKFFGVNGIQIESTIQGIQIDGSELIGGEVDLTGYATKAYSDAGDLALSNRIDAVEGVVSHYQYIIQTANATPRNGQLAFLKADMSTTTRWNEATNISVNPTSISGDVWPTDEIVTGDVLRFYLKGDITMEVSAFEAKVVQNNNNLFSIETVVKEVGTIMDGEEYEAVHLSSFDPSGLATMDYVDAQDQQRLALTGGTLTGNLVGELVKSQRSSGFAFEVKPGNQITTGYWNSNGHLSLNPHVADKGYCFSVYTSGLGEDKCGFRVTQDGKVKAGHDTSNPFMATSANDVVTKGFFDENAVTAKPAMLCWKYAGDKGTTTESPASGYFNLSQSGDNKYLRFSFNSDNGVGLGDGKFSDTNANFEYGPVGTIWMWVGSTGKWKLKQQFRIQAWRWNYKPDPAGNSHFEFRMSSSHGHGWSELTTGSRYYITVGGFF